MPGFLLGFTGEDKEKNAPSPWKPIYTFAWDIEKLFNEEINVDSPLIYLKDCTPPQFSFTAEEYESASIKMKYASRIGWDDVKVSFYDTASLLPIIKEWQERIWNASDGIKLAADYKSDSIIKLYDAAGGMVGQWILHGSWPKQVGFSALTYTSSDIHSVDVVVAYDWATLLPY